MLRRLKLVAAAVIILLLVACVGFYAWTRSARYPAFSEATALAEQARNDRGWYVFEPSAKPRATLIFYPGGLVDAAAYAPLMQRLSDDGIRAVIVPMPLELAVFGVNRADDVIAAYPDEETWILGGHSLGGAMTAEYLKKKPGAAAGVVFLASYPSDSTDLSSIPAKVLSIYGSEDGVAGDVFDDSLQRLPKGTKLKVIEGGNHAQFGDYGPQKGDGTATIGRVEQQQQTAEAIVGLVRELK